MQLPVSHGPRAAATFAASAAARRIGASLTALTFMHAPEPKRTSSPCNRLTFRTGTCANVHAVASIWA